MKKLFIVIFSIILFLGFHTNNAQTFNWNVQDSSRHMATVGLGWDYSVSYGMGYSYKLITERPVVIHADFSVPSGNKSFDDFKIKIGTQILILNSTNLKAAITIDGIYRRYETGLVRLQNFGSDIAGTFGYYRPKWFAAVESGFDKAIITHFRHSKKFKNDIYSDVIDGWYQPSTGGNFYYGVLTGISVRRHDVYLRIGKVLTQDFKTTPLIPYYLRLGYNYRLSRGGGQLFKK